MSHPYDAALKDILGHSVLDLTPPLHLPELPARTLNVDLATVSAATDVAFGFGEPLQQIVDINVQSGPDVKLAARLQLYNVAYHYHFSVPVRTIVMLLRPKADHPRLTGKLAYHAGRGRVEFRYEIVRLWRQPLALYLHGGLGLLPLAPLCQLPKGVPVKEALQEVIHQIDHRLVAEAPFALATKLMTATFVLAGMRVRGSGLNDIFRGVKVMLEESSAFTLFEEKGRKKGRLEGLQEALLRLGSHRFGPPDEATITTVNAIDDLNRLKRMTDAVLTVRSWHKLLATP